MIKTNQKTRADVKKNPPRQGERLQIIRKSAPPKKPGPGDSAPPETPATRKKSAQEAATLPATGGERIAKILARAGVASRRDVEKMIFSGRVMVNGVVLESPALVLRGDEYITVDGQAVAAAEATRLWRCHKPRNVMITHRDPEGRPTLFEILPQSLPRVVSVGRLDFTSEGLILLTNDGELARGLELPAKGWKRVYRARVFGKIAPDKLAALAQGIEIDGVKYGAVQAGLDSERGDNCWLTLTLTEGKNREIRKIIEFLGGQVTRLIRVSYGPFQLGMLAPGEIDEISTHQIRSLGLNKK
ncbi:MAG: pseudouridine synthase [Candidatus Symbiobacter sp.]|nr:pseudouridine synthase [Candidatus Symbiobacter sp.]